MSKIAKIYAEAVGRKSEEQEKPVDPTKQLDNELSVQAKMDWLQSPVTSEMFLDLKDDENSLLKLAITESVRVSGPVNTQLIIQLLTRVDTLRKVREVYASTK